MLWYLALVPYNRRLECNKRRRGLPVDNVIGEGMEEFQDELMKEYVLDAKEHIETIENLVVTLERTKALKKHEIDELFRAYHTIKGNSALVDLNDIRDLSHIVETMIGEIRNGDMAMSPEVADIILNSADMIKKMVAEISESNKSDTDPKGLIDYIKRFREEYKNVVKPVDKPDPSNRKKAKMRVRVTDTLAIFEIPENFSGRLRGKFLAELRKFQQKGLLKFVFSYANTKSITGDGIELINLARKEVEQAGGKLANCEISDNVASTFKSSGLSEELSIKNSLKEAVEAVSS